MNFRNLPINLLRCESEDDVHLLISGLGPHFGWKPLDGRETNFNVVTNQAASGAKALTELCTNMVDAILMRRATELGIDPMSESAPQSVVEAIKALVKLKGARSGVLAEVDDAKYLREYAESNLVIGVTGSTGRPCFTFVDSGEGQRPSAFPDTFLSLSSGRKKDIPFVQGKYNMGSSGVLSYCGRHWYKLVLSRRFDDDGPWGWTLIRRRPGDGPPIAEYLIKDGGIPTCAETAIRPFVLRSGQEDGKVERRTGTVIKLFSYVFGSAANFRTIREAIDENLVSTVLPFRLMDYRVAPNRARGGRRAVGVDERTLKGMEYQLRGIVDPEDDEAAPRLGQPIHVAAIEHPDLGRISIQAIALSAELPGWLKRRNVNRVYHAVNGQVQYKQTRGFLSRQCGRPGLKDRVVLLVDASALTEAAHNDVWKGDRETIRQTEVGRAYEEEVTEAIKDSAALRELERRLAADEMKRVTKEAETSLLRSLVQGDPNIAQLLPGGSLVTLPHGSPPGGNRKKRVGTYGGKRSPTYVKLPSLSLRDSGIDVAVGDIRRVRFETDAANDWLVRPDNRGCVVLEGDAERCLSQRASLRDGRLTLTFGAVPGRARVGSEIAGRVVLKDDEMAEPVHETIRVRVVAARPKQKSGTRVPPGAGDDGQGGDGAAQRKLPRTQWLTRDGRDVHGEASSRWPDGFTERSGGRARMLSEEEQVYEINYDNVYFHAFVARERRHQQEEALAEQYRVGMLVMMMGFEFALNSSPRRDELEEGSDEFREIFAQGAANVVMSIAKTLPRMLGEDAAMVED